MGFLVLLVALTSVEHLGNVGDVEFYGVGQTNASTSRSANLNPNPSTATKRARGTTKVSTATRMIRV